MAELILANKSDIVMLADALRITTGTTSGKSFNQMVDDVNDVNNITNIQAELIAQIKNALNGKTVISGGSGGGSIETCTVTISIGDMAEPIDYTVYYTDSNMNVQSATSDGMITLTVPKSVMLGIHATSIYSVTLTNANLIAQSNNLSLVNIENDNASIVLA